MPARPSLIEELQRRCGAAATGEFRNQSRVVVPLADLKPTLQWLRDGLQILKRAGDSEGIARRVRDSGGVVMVPAFRGTDRRPGAADQS